MEWGSQVVGLSSIHQRALLMQGITCPLKLFKPLLGGFSLQVQVLYIASGNCVCLSVPQYSHYPWGGVMFSVRQLCTYNENFWVVHLNFAVHFLIYVKLCNLYKFKIWIITEHLCVCWKWVVNSEGCCGFKMSSWTLIQETLSLFGGECTLLLHLDLNHWNVKNVWLFCR